MTKSGSFLSVDNPNVIVTVVKQAENNDDLIIRCVETAGEDTKATINLDFADRSWKGNFRGCEIKTLRLDRDAGRINEVNILEDMNLNLK